VVFEWLMTAALGPAVVAVPVGWAADAGADAARRWFRRFRRTDDLSRLVRAAEIELSFDHEATHWGARWIDQTPAW
jgi:hypothetical protein